MQRHSFLGRLSVSFVLCAVFSGPLALAADSTNLKTLTPEELVGILNRKTAKSTKPLLFQVGSHMLYVQAHIPGSEYIGQGNTPMAFSAWAIASASYRRKFLSSFIVAVVRGAIART